MLRTFDLVRSTIKRITPYSPGKNTDDVKRELGIDEVTKLASNENPLGPSPLAIEAMQKAAADMAVYPDPQCTELSSMLAAHMTVLPENIIVGVGSDEMIHLLGLAFLNPGDEVLFSQFPFAMYPMLAFVNNCDPIQVPAKGFEHDLDAMADAITSRTKIIFVGNPCNPTGTISTQADVDRFMKRVPDHVIVAFDQAYYEYVDDPEYPDCLEYVRQGRRVAVLRTFSKVYGLAGLRVGYAACAKSVADALKLVRPPFNVSAMAQVAAIASLQDEEQVIRSRQMVLDGKNQLYAAFEKLGLTYVPTQANFILVDTGMHSREVFDGLMRRGVTIRTGDIFDLPTWIRVTIGTSEQNATFINALAEVLA